MPLRLTFWRCNFSSSGFISYSCICDIIRDLFESVPIQWIHPRLERFLTVKLVFCRHFLTSKRFLSGYILKFQVHIASFTSKRVFSFSSFLSYFVFFTFDMILKVNPLKRCYLKSHYPDTLQSWHQILKLQQQEFGVRGWTILSQRTSQLLK